MADKQTTLAEAFAQAQAEVENPHLDSTNPHFRSKFASLKAVRDAVIPVFAKHGIAIIQDLVDARTAKDAGPGGVACYNHIKGHGEEWEFGPFIVTNEKGNAHGAGSAATYARRYSLMAIAGVVGDPDDDGNTAVEAREGASEVAGGENSGNGPLPTGSPAADAYAALEAVVEEEKLEGLKAAWPKVDEGLRQEIGKTRFNALKAKAQGVPF